MPDKQESYLVLKDHNGKLYREKVIYEWAIQDSNL